MTTRAEVQEEIRAKHRWRALMLFLVCIAIVVVYTVFLVLMATHMPRTLEEAEDVTGMWSTEVEMEWGNLVVDHTSDLSKGNLDWEITSGPENETLKTGSHEEHGDDVIIVELGEGGTYGVHLTPTGVNSAVEYDVTVRDFYVSPVTIEVVKIGALFVLAFLAPFLWYAWASRYTAKYRDLYGRAWMTIAGTMLLSGIVSFTPWV
jgi:cell division protein FtsL